MEQRLLAEERRAEAGLRLDQHATLVPELRSLTAQHPLQERFWAQLMMAVSRSGRQGEAPTAYHRLAQLSDDLGIEPCPQLRTLHEALLRGETGHQPRTVTRSGPALGDTLGPRQGF